MMMMSRCIGASSDPTSAGCVDAAVRVGDHGIGVTLEPLSRPDVGRSSTAGGGASITATVAGVQAAVAKHGGALREAPDAALPPAWGSVAAAGRRAVPTHHPTRGARAAPPLNYRLAPISTSLLVHSPPPLLRGLAAAAAEKWVRR